MSINTDISTSYEWIARRANQNSFTATFTSGGAFNISTYTFSLNFYSIGSDTAALTLSQGSGLTNGGAAGTLAVSLTAANITASLANDGYAYLLTYLVGGITYPLLNGILYLYKQNNVDSDPDSSFSASVLLGSNAVTMTITT
jgi:hypothetical protein